MKSDKNIKHMLCREYARYVRAGYSFYYSAERIKERFKIPCSFGGFQEHMEKGSPDRVTMAFFFCINNDFKHANANHFRVLFCVDGWWVHSSTFFQVLEIQERENHCVIWDREPD